MASLPSIWRVELWHPMVVHFPIALLLIGTVLRLLAMRRSRWQSLQFCLPAGRALLALGTVGAWVAIWTGSEAYYEVVRTLCDPTVADTHNNLAFWTAGLFTAGLVIDGARQWFTLPTKWSKPTLALLALIYLTGTTTLLYTGHLGAQLVYQQGAGVYQPSENCSEFIPS
jgi:uncharacterized membrane protein